MCLNACATFREPCPSCRSILEENLVLIDRILALDPDTPLARRERGVNLISVGDRWMLIGNTQRALAAYESGLGDRPTAPEVATG